MSELHDAPRVLARDLDPEDSDADLWIVRHLEAYLVRLRAEARDADDAERRLHALSGQIQATLDLATKGAGPAGPAALR